MSAVSSKLRFLTVVDHHHFVSSLTDVILQECYFHIYKMIKRCF